MTTLWERTVAELRHALPSQEFAAWISCLRTSVDASDALTVEAPTLFHRNWVQQNLLERIRETAATVAGRPVAVQVAVGAPLAPGLARPLPVAPLPSAPVVAPAPTSGPHDDRLLSFETFVVGPSNELAWSAARTVAEAPGREYNPLFLHGGVGLGKTHLLQAIAHAMRTRHRRLRVLALSAERFITEMVTAVRRQQMDAFHLRFRKADALIVDDVQFIAGKERTQEEFFHTFNLLCTAGKQIVVSSDKPPRAIPNLEEGLRSRFEGGMIAEIQRPTRETRRGILLQKAQQAGLVLDPEIADYLAGNIPATSVRELEGAITRLRAIAALESRPVDLELARKALGPLHGGPVPGVSPERIEQVVAAAFDLDRRRLASPQRAARLVRARHIAMFLMRKRLGLSYGEIGIRYERDHSTVLHAVRAIEHRIACDPEVRRLVSALEDQF